MTDNATTVDAVDTDEPRHASAERADNGSNGHRHGRRRRSKSSRQLIKVQRSNRNLKIGLAVLIMALTGVIVVGKQVQSQMSQRSAQLEQDIDRLRLKLADAEALSKKLLTDMNALVESRLPGLRPLEFDKIIQISEQYIKNVIFAVSRDSEETKYEYRFVFFNPKITPVFPRVKLHLFNNRGLEVGGADVTLTGQASEGRVRSLGPGEIRSYNGSVAVLGDGQPSYFMLEIHAK